MATLTQTRRHIARPYGLGGAFDDMRGRFGQWRSYRRTSTELNSLTDRELVDLGLNRSMIRRVALETVYGPDV